MKSISIRIALLFSSWLTIVPSVAAATPASSAGSVKKVATGAKKGNAKKKRARRPIFSGYRPPRRSCARTRSAPLGPTRLASVNDPSAQVSVKIYNADGSTTTRHRRAQPFFAAADVAEKAIDRTLRGPLARLRHFASAGAGSASATKEHDELPLRRQRSTWGHRVPERALKEYV